MTTFAAAAEAGDRVVGEVAPVTHRLEFLEPFVMLPGERLKGGGEGSSLDSLFLLDHSFQGQGVDEEVLGSGAALERQQVTAGLKFAVPLACDCSERVPVDVLAGQALQCLVAKLSPVGRPSATDEPAPRKRTTRGMSSRSCRPMSAMTFSSVS